MHYYFHHIGDFVKATSRLSDAESMAYLRLMWLYYEQEKPLVDNKKVLAFQIGSNEETVDLILQSFFKLEDGFWHQTRCDELIESYQKQSTGGKKGAKNRWNKEKTKGGYSPPIATPMPSPIATNNQKPITNNQINTKTPEGVTDSVFQDFLKLRKQHKAPLTETALKGLMKEAEKAKISLQEVMEICCQRGWRGFKADWVIQEAQKSKEMPLATDQQIEAAYRAECGDPTKARFNSYFEMKKFIIDQREKRNKNA